MKYVILVLGIFLLSASSSCKQSPTDEELVTSLSVPGTGLTARHHDHKIRIDSISTGVDNKHVITIQGQQYEVSPFSQMSGTWVNGQRVKLSGSSQSSYYDVLIKNLDNGETVKARRVQPEPSQSQF